MRPGTGLKPNFTPSQTAHRTRSLTPGLQSKRAANLTCTNWDTFFLNENAKLPLNSPAVPQETEKGEYALQLKILKNQLNKTRFKCTSIESSLASTKIKMINIDNNEKASIQRLRNSCNKVKSLEQELERMKINIDFANIDYNSYKYVRQRMMICRVFYEIKANEMRKKLKCFNDVVNEQENLLNKVLNNNGKVLTNFKVLADKVRDEETWKDLIGKKLEKEVSKKEEMVDIREEMNRRRIDIIESVANEDKNQRSNFLREGLLLSRTWCKFLSAKLHKEKEKSSYMEKAHAKIRSLTGHSNISSVVQKVLTKEQSYSNLMNMIMENKKICDNYYQKNIELENEMHEITVNYKEPDLAIQENLKIFIRKGVKISSRNLEKLTKLKFAKSFIMQWVKNMIKKINGESVEGDIKKLFKELRKNVHLKVRKCEKVEIPFEFSPILKGKSVIQEEIFNFADLVYPEDYSSESSHQYDRLYRKKTTKKQ